MWNCDGSWIDLDREELERIQWNLEPRKEEVMAYDCSTGVFEKPIRRDMLDATTYALNILKENTEHVSVQNELNKAAEITKNEIAKAWTRQYVNSFCSVKSIEVSVDHRTIVVVWADGDKTIVKRSAKDPDDLYMAFTAALAKKVYGSNSAIKRLINKKGNEHKPKKKNEKVRVVKQKKKEATE